ncbi:MAG TPA: TetR/AcrR family transcriptional regulator [Micromonosporaceae bacterium]
MPRVSEQHREARRAQILAAARRCFLRNGFHNTSMQDVIGEAGLSVGAVYRYFPSKSAIITAIAEEAVGTATDALAELATLDPPPPLAEAVALAVDALEPLLGPDGVLRIAIQVWAEAMRDDDLAEFVARVYGELRARFVALAERARASGALAADADVEGVGAVLFALLPGYGLQRVLTGGPSREAFLSGVRTLLG